VHPTVSPRSWVVLLIVAAIGCAIPGRLYEVAPPVSGRIHGGDQPIDEARLRLRVVHVESADLHSHEQDSPAADGRFAFAPMELAVAGHEYSKNYRIFLHYRVGDENRVIWRVQFSRRALAGPVELDCDLARPVEHGQPCWVRNPLEHPWLAQQGERTYRRFCVGCHGADGRGVIGVDEGSGEPAPDLRTIAARDGNRFDRAEISEWIEGRSLPDEHGDRSMPVWGERLSAKYERFSDSEALVGAALGPLVVYLESIQEPE
jgi:hypothetical protein